MRLVAAIALGVFAVGALMTWATDWAIGGADGDTIGAILMIGAGVILLALIFLSASRSPAGRSGALESEAIERAGGSTVGRVAAEIGGYPFPRMHGRR